MAMTSTNEATHTTKFKQFEFDIETRENVPNTGDAIFFHDDKYIVEHRVFDTDRGLILILTKQVSNYD
jgi:hypothetical protein